METQQTFETPETPETPAKPKKNPKDPKPKESKPFLGEQLIPLDKIVIEANPSRKWGVREEDVKARAESIQLVGLIDAITVNPPNADGLYVLLAGETRYRAYRLLQTTSKDSKKWSEIRARISDKLHLEVAIASNVNRTDLTPIDRLHCIQLLENKGLTQTAIAKRMNMTQPAVSQHRKLAGLTLEWQHSIHDGDCPMYLAVKYVVDLPEGNQASLFKSMDGDYTDTIFKQRCGAFTPAKETPAPQPNPKVDPLPNEDSDKDDPNPKTNSREREASAATAGGVSPERKPPLKTSAHAEFVLGPLRDWMNRKAQEHGETPAVSGARAAISILGAWLNNPEALTGTVEGAVMQALEHQFGWKK